ncbi:oxygenase MpaB family protein [Phytopseudomonas dryadis]|uniref:Histidine kinase n=1 Tax=Phytopseudomonas dryadis TaxID=2487520 RepID=A0A4Q9RA71_9GAMM|nr:MULTISPECIES: oxygenase MpaB family protein [Pseudomonas]TBU96685.1 histidine kinase [Pseudomonas dryadis]TBV07341.1 histidine kinase [Pseudomonas dryadis]TBV17794.1 histidine kinase [Pseudomonas sp. FRB 230]
MEFIRRRIESQVLGLSGVALGQIDFDNPRGDPGLFGPDSVCWRVHGDFTSMLIGGISALLLQALHPLALAGVWDHSNFREDLLGRLRRTGQFVSGTTFASRQDADWLIDKVKRIHLQVVGSAPDGRPYAASDPALLTWVHVAEVHSFMRAHLRYRNPRLSGADQDRYYAETALIAERLGAREVPRNGAEAEAYLQAMRGQLLCDQRSREILRILLTAPAPSALAAPVGRLLMQAGIDLLPDWAQDMLEQRITALRSRLIHGGVHSLAPVLRWAVRSGALHRSRRRMGLPPY